MGSPHGPSHPQSPEAAAQPRHSLALLAVIKNDGVIVAAGNDGLAVGAEVEAVDLVRVLAEDLSHAEAPQHVVRQLHPARRAAPREGGGAAGSRAGLRVVSGAAGAGGPGRWGAVGAVRTAGCSGLGAVRRRAGGCPSLCPPSCGSGGAARGSLGAGRGQGAVRTGCWDGVGWGAWRSC